MGAAELREGDTVEALIARADAQLYRAKGEGRNRTCLEPTALSLVSAEEKSLLFATSAAIPFDDDPVAPSHRPT